MSAVPGKREFILAFSDRKGAQELTGGAADARRIQNVLFGHGRAGDTGLGAEIQSYLFELGDSKTLSDVRGKVEMLVRKYCPDVAINDIVVDTLPASEDPSGRGSKSLVIGMSLGTLGVPYDFALVARQDISRVVVASLVL